MVERLVHSIVRLTLKHRWFSLGWLAAFTIFFAYQALAVRMYSKFSDLLPQAHPYVVAYNHFRQIFGTANVMTLELQVRRGDIFTAKTLHKIRFIHQQLDLMDGVDHNLINSITGTNARKVIATSGGLIISRPLLADKIPTSRADLARIRYDVLHSLAYGVLVSPDATSALVTAGFNEGQVDYGEMHRRLAGIKLGVATIPLVRKVAFFASFWGFSNIFTILILLPLLLDVLPTPKVTRHYVPHWMALGLHWVGESCTSRRGRWVVFGIAAIVVALGLQQSIKLPIRYTEPGSPLLWQNSDFNVSSRHINRSYGGSNELVIYLEGDRENAMKDPALLALLDNFSHYMLERPQASGSRYITSLVGRLHSLFHYHDPVWQVYPKDLKGIGQMIFMYQSSSPSPTIIFQYMDYMARDGQFVIYYKDLEGSTVLEALTRARQFIAAHPTPHVKFILAGGSIGLTAALNDEIAYSDRVSTLLILAVVFTLVALSYASLTAGAMVLMTLIAAGVVSFLYIGLKGVGININTLPVTAVGMGIDRK